MADTKPHTIPTEGDGVNYRGIVWFVVVLTVTTLVCQLLMWVMLRAFQHQTPTAAVSPVAEPVQASPALEGRVYPQLNAIGRPAGPQPPLLVYEPGNLAQFRAREQQLLTTYGWVDQNAGVVRIPVEKAKDLLLTKGLPVRVKDVKEVKEVK
jgi:hypothetical protein